MWILVFLKYSLDLCCECLLLLGQGLCSMCSIVLCSIVLFPLIDLIFFHTSAVGIDKLQDETYLNHDSFLLSLMIFRNNVLYFVVNEVFLKVKFFISIISLLIVFDRFRILSIPL